MGAGRPLVQRLLPVLIDVLRNLGTDIVLQKGRRLLPISSSSNMAY